MGNLIDERAGWKWSLMSNGLARCVEAIYQGATVDALARSCAFPDLSSFGLS